MSMHGDGDICLNPGHDLCTRSHCLVWLPARSQCTVGWAWMPDRPLFFIVSYQSFLPHTQLCAGEHRTLSLGKGVPGMNGLRTPILTHARLLCILSGFALHTMDRAPATTETLVHTTQGCDWRGSALFSSCGTRSGSDNVRATDIQSLLAVRREDGLQVWCSHLRLRRKSGHTQQTIPPSYSPLSTLALQDSLSDQQRVSAFVRPPVSLDRSQPTGRYGPDQHDMTTPVAVRADQELVPGGTNGVQTACADLRARAGAGCSFPKQTGKSGQGSINDADSSPGALSLRDDSDKQVDNHLFKAPEGSTVIHRAAGPTR
jgi:hypothetical protein